MHKTAPLDDTLLQSGPLRTLQMMKFFGNQAVTDVIQTSFNLFFKSQTILDA